MQTIGERIVFLREEMDISQIKLADMVGLTNTTLYKYEKNKCEPRSEIIARLSDVLNTTADFLIGRTNDPSPLVKNPEKEELYQKNNELINKFNLLPKEDQIRIEERINTLYEKMM